MKIKTIFNESAAAFDAEVNEALDSGWHLVRRFSDLPEGFIAELVRLEPEPVAQSEPQPADPIGLLRAIQEACLGTAGENCGTDRCPLNSWCEQLRDGGDPTDWVLPGEVDR